MYVGMNTRMHVCIDECMYVGMYMMMMRATKMDRLPAFGRPPRIVRRPAEGRPPRLVRRPAAATSTEKVLKRKPWAPLKG